MGWSELWVKPARTQHLSSPVSLKDRKGCVGHKAGKAVRAMEQLDLSLIHI